MVGTSIFNVFDKYGISISELENQLYNNRLDDPYNRYLIKTHSYCSPELKQAIESINFLYLTVLGIYD
jgi:hypothetical protein